MVIWITGLSGAGKTTLAQSIYKLLKKKYKNLIWFDGDTMRDLNEKNNKYDKESRIQQYNKLIKFVNFCHDQKINVIVSALYFNKNLEKNNKKLFKYYFQIYLRSNIKELIKRNNKKIYSKNLKKKIPNIVGYDIKWYEPIDSNLVINDFYKKKVKKISEGIAKNIKRKINKFT